MSYEFGFQQFVQQGWECPKCHRVYSPMTTMCYYCGNEKNVVYTTETTEVIDKISGMPVNEGGKSTTSSGKSYTIHSSSRCDYPNNVCENH